MMPSLLMFNSNTIVAEGQVKKRMGKQKCKLMIVDTFEYNELKDILNAIEALGYNISFADNGNILVEEKESR